MQNIETASSFLTNYLPEDILQIIDLQNLSLQKDSFIEKELQEAFSDILYKTSIKGKETYKDNVKIERNRSVMQQDPSPLHPICDATGSVPNAFQKSRPLFVNDPG